MQGLNARVAALVVLLGIGTALPAAAMDGWQGARSIDAGDNDAGQPRVACDEDGNAIVVFEQFVGAVNHVFANRYAAGVGWQGAVRLDTAAGKRSSAPVVSVDARGNAVAIYRQEDAPDVWSVRVNRFSPEIGWGDPEEIAGGGGSVEEARVAHGPDGEMLALISRKDALGTPRIYAIRYVEGWGWTPSGDPIDAGAGSAQFPRIAFAPDGTAWAIFRQGDPNRRTYATRWDGTAWSAPKAIDGGLENAVQQQLAVGADGNAVAVFVHGGPVDSRVYANRSAGGAWSGPTAVSGNVGLVSGPSIAVDGDGNAMIAYVKHDGEHDRVYVNRYEPSVGWGESIRINAGEQDAGAPRIAAAPDGDAIAVFHQKSGGAAYRVYANRYADGEWTGATTVDGGSDSVSPDIAFGGDGNALCTFIARDGAVNSVMVNRYVSPLPLVDLTPNTRGFERTDRITVTADVRPIETEAYPFVRVVMAEGETLYYERGRGFSISPVPYLGFAAGPITVPSAIAGYDVLTADFSNIPEGIYRLEGGAVDAAATVSADELIYLGAIDTERLLVQ